MPNIILMPNMASRINGNCESIVEVIPVLLHHLEVRLVRAAALIGKCADGESKRALLAESAAISSLIVQAREKAGRLISRSQD